MKVRVGVEIGICRKEDVIELDDDHFADMDAEAKQRELDALANSFAADHVNTWADIIEEGTPL